MIEKERFHTLLTQGKMEEIRKLTEEVLNDGEPPEAILKDGFIQAMDRIGARFKGGEIYIPEVLIAARAMHAGMEVLKPILSKSTTRLSKKVAIGTVKGDLHDIGKNLVAMMVEGNGFKVVDLGVDVSPEKFVEAVKANSADLCMMSALLTTTMPVMKATIEALKEAGLGGKVKTLIGGVSVTQDFANKIGADGFGSNATAAVKAAKALIGRRS